MATAATTAEWICTRCGATNRKLVPYNVDSDAGPLRHLSRRA